MLSIGFFSKLSKKEKMGLVGAGIVIMAVVIDQLVIHPMGTRLQRMGQEIAFSEKKLSHDLRNIHNKDFIAGEYKKYRDFVKKGAASDEENVSNMLAEIEGLARTAGVTLVDIKPQAAKQVDFYKEYAAEVTIEGQMEEIVAFLYKLNSSPQLLRTVKLRLGVKQKDSSAVRASMLVTNISM
ncbi:MAG: type 4a pilus biogenesis protein PilO [Candidatus Omnitrophica bacterium]|nr:type 4a pilus biogenesis protein PilO [Candidatus Omnitrophota bacterium]